MGIKLDCGESSFVPKDTPITILTFMVDGIWIFVLRICGRPLPQAPVQWAAICYRHCRFTFSRPLFSCIFVSHHPQTPASSKTTRCAGHHHDYTFKDLR